ncbi:hypothetical protein [Paenibacillus kribbensis]|uniref:hypothetical protein n=1 Tax=Paenibacillus kribbensis TaxID=172713 RepID=UPI0015BFF405|nr:hypothetical protein [Paenibacillus kribbensis]
MYTLDQITKSITDAFETLINIKLLPSQNNVPIFSDEMEVSPWAVIHVIDLINKRYNFIFDVSDIAANPIFSIDDFAQSLYWQLLKINT